MTTRLSHALDQGGLVLPDDGLLSVLVPEPSTDLGCLDRSRVQIVQPFRPHFVHFSQAGFDCVPQDPGSACVAAILCLPRAKALARALVHTASMRSSGLVIIDGSKINGVDSLLKDVRKRAPIGGQISKAHGRIFWFGADARAFADWAPPQDQQVDGFLTAPGVFSADGVDPASRLLADTLPGKLGRAIVDLGAGWGYLSARLQENSGFEHLDVVEADHIALDCARRNVVDPRARFHWADALNWQASGPVDTVVMNPPFHTARKADPSLGQGFVGAAARILSPTGNLWMVANRHLPYEATLAAHFSEAQEIAGDNRFKVIRATRPSRARR